MSSPVEPDPADRSIAIIGGGAAGFFAAITAAEANPHARVTIYEGSRHILSKVRISGGGRCNVTHYCFDPVELATRYPRGSKELRAAFHRWQPSDTIGWFADRSVALKAEEDGRMFPTTDDSRTIVDCFRDAAECAGVRVQRERSVRRVLADDDRLVLVFADESTVTAGAVCVAVGSLKASTLNRSLESLGHTIEPLAPSLFAFNISDRRIHGLAGLSVPNVTVRALPKSAPQTGPLLITHRGLSGPAILKLSAWEARSLQQANYRYDIEVNWLAGATADVVRQRFASARRSSGRASVSTRLFDEVPKRLWQRLVAAAGIDERTTWAELPKQKEIALARELTAGCFRVQGKTTNKEEFVTCGGVRLTEVDFRTMQSRKVPGLYFAGECLDIDGVTGGFNFQAAWTGGRIAGLAMAERVGRAR